MVTPLGPLIHLSGRLVLGKGWIQVEIEDLGIIVLFFKKPISSMYSLEILLTSAIIWKIPVLKFIATSNLLIRNGLKRGEVITCSH